MIPHPAAPLLRAWLTNERESICGFARRAGLDAPELSKFLAGKRQRLTIDHVARIVIATRGDLHWTALIRDEKLQRQTRAILRALGAEARAET